MEFYPREYYLKKIRPFYHDHELIKVLTGIRRCGKSTILNLIKKELESAGVQKEQIIDINLDKRGFKSIRTLEALEKKIDELSVGKDTVRVTLSTAKSIPFSTLAVEKSVALGLH